ncbi:MAG: type I secretion C-terminal target domain-containing protein, partial [Rhodospirillales bacterium]|nr:type I secretion C-terminal target domain-containing protein [Rhodospirillales bacterium]
AVLAGGLVFVYKLLVTTRAAPLGGAPVEGGAPTRTASGNTGTSGNDLFNNVYGDTATRTGGAGDDTYVVADDRLKIVEKPGEGIDSLRLWIDYRLPENVENARVEAPWGLSVNGNALSNIIAGGAGDDVINGRGGDDLLSGGGGSDVFIVTAGNGYDTITDFKPGTDRLVLDGYGLKNFAAVQAAMTMVGGDTVLTLDNGETVTFKGVAKSAFTAADFRFTSVTKGGAADPTPSPDPDPTPDPDPVPAPGGNNVLKLRVAEDAYQGDAQFKVLVDGKQFGGVQTVTARHGAGQWQELTLTGDIGSGSHKIEIVYLNDLYGGSTAADRNLYVDWIELDGNRVEAETGTLDPALGAKWGGEVLIWSNGTLAFNNVAGAAPDPTPSPEPDPTPAPDPDPAPVPGGNNVLKLRVAEDAYQGDAQFKVLVDGKQFGGVQTVTARHGAGQWQELTLTGDIGAGSHKIEIVYLNDLYGGSTAADRNLYVDWIELDGNRVEAETGTLDPALGAKRGGEALLWSNGTLAFNNVAGAAPDPTPGPEPDPTPAPGPDPAPGTGPVIVNPAARPTPDIARSYVGPDSTGTARGTAKAEDIFASAEGQTLMGGGGDDVFHVGSFSNVRIVVPESGITTVSTWATRHTLADGVDNLVLQGNYAHDVRGNALANTIVGSDGNDVIDAGAGDDTIVAGSGANRLTGGAGHDLFVFRSGAARDNVITDFRVGEDMIDLAPVVAASGYAGVDALADRVLRVEQVGADAVISLDPDGTGAAPAHRLVTLKNVIASSLHDGHDFLWS